MPGPTSSWHHLTTSVQSCVVDEADSRLSDRWLLLLMMIDDDDDAVGDTTCGQKCLYQLGMTGIPIYNVRYFYAESQQRVKLKYVKKSCRRNCI